MSVGLYIHVPFCLRKCLYCDFTSYPRQEEQVQLYLQSLTAEMVLYGDRLDARHKSIKTIFVGGGTPTCLRPEYLAGILEQVGKVFSIEQGAEITTEANPGTVNLPALKELRAVGFNRLSLGVQSTHRELLRLIGRIHTFSEARQAVTEARIAGFENINLDLIFGLPTQTAAQWRQSLHEIMALQPEHISCYGLQLEENTPLTKAVEQGQLKPCPEEEELAMYQMARQLLGENGYQHYEISNFAQAGYQCRHNLLYWQNQAYLGLGPAAHSYLNQSRWGNVEGIEEYASLVKQGQRPVAEKTTLTIKEQMEETVFLGLRMLEGVNVESFQQRFGKSLQEIFGKQVSSLTAKGLLEQSFGHLKLTEKALPLANQVFAEFV
ncbi:radical SAM family heme chaperone HemW [Desulforamulus aeronauticus]|uniref:Heme chaperone HemW n=1 Tax=Desulforamulus aeronauticus DSM 10349 TaxID=1121421 RepID=A0A1M6VCL5_9FIRM|nr:radical SAM family heme chaperone HemW [Desulforamulus aeronauticus]SHK79277.1 oxygen-independent coproporphyrinogen-3 oxidase [Desulforamulus aeronauticus DSM 10349]